MNNKHTTRDFDLNLMKVLDVVISAGNAVRASGPPGLRASERLRVTPAAVSLALQRLQYAYKEELFIRTRSGLSPTAKAREIHRAYRQAMEIINDTLSQGHNESNKYEVKILSSELSEQFYFAHLFGFDDFERYSLRHFSSRG